MRIILLSVLLGLSFAAQAQVEDSTQYMFYKNEYGHKWLRGRFTKLLGIPNKDNGATPSAKNFIAGDSTGQHLYIYDGTAWNEVEGGTGNSAQDTLAGGPFTSIPVLGFDPGTNLTPAEVIQAAFYKAEAPTAALTGGITQELMAPGADLTYPVNWLAGRKPSTKLIQTVTVAGITQLFSQPTPGTSTSGSQQVSVPRNVATTVQLTVVSADGQVTLATTKYDFLPKRYFGWVNNQLPTDAEVIAAGGELSTARDKNWTLPAPSGEQYIVYAYPASEGLLTQFNINGFTAKESVFLTQRNLTNASGFTQLYDIYISYKAQTASTDVSVK
jgi:hypothetical protein